MSINQSPTLQNQHIYRDLRRVALPIALQSFIASSLQLVDSLMVGSLGEAELAAVGVSLQIYFVYWMVIFGFSSGCSTFMTQFWGAGDVVQIRKTAGFNVTVCVAGAMIFFIPATFFPEAVLGIFTNIPETIAMGKDFVVLIAPCFLLSAYSVPMQIALRTTQQTKIPLYISIVTFSANTLLCYTFVFGKFGAPQMGVEGAAMATLIARTLEAILVTYMIFGRKNIIAGKFRSFFGWSKAFAGRILSNSIPTTINETMWGLGTAMYVAAYARVGITEFAAVQAGNTIQNILVMAGFSIGDAILILVGQKLGEGKTEEAYHLAKRLLRIGVIIGLVFGGLLILIAKPIISLYNFSPQGEKYTLYILVIYGATMWLILLGGMLVVGVMRCGGDTKYAMVTEVGTVWLIGVPLAFFTTMVLGLPIYLAVLAVKTEEVVKAVILLRRFYSRKWAKNMVDDLKA
jgi:putative MATE family efflux protein